MKAVVVDIDGKHAVALDDKGKFIRIKNNGSLIIGNEVDTAKSAVPGFSAVKKPLAAAIFIFALVLSYGAYSYSSPYSYIDIDINPSIELTANVFDRVIKAEGLNEDGKKLLSNSAYKYKSLNSAVEGILADAAGRGYLKSEDENAVMFTVSGKNDDKVVQLEKKVENAASRQLESVSIKSDILIEDVTLQKREDALKQGISPGKLLLIEKLEELDPSVNVDEYRNVPVRDIMKSIKTDKNIEKSRVEDGRETDSAAADNKDKSQTKFEKTGSEGQNDQKAAGVSTGSSWKDETRDTKHEDLTGKQNGYSDGHGNGKEDAKENKNGNGKDRDNGFQTDTDVWNNGNKDKSLNPANENNRKDNAGDNSASGEKEDKQDKPDKK